MNLNGKYSVFTIRLKPADVRKIKREAKQRDIPISQLVRDMIRKQLAGLAEP